MTSDMMYNYFTVEKKDWVSEINYIQSLLRCISTFKFYFNHTNLKNQYNSFLRSLCKSEQCIYEIDFQSN